MVVKDGSDYDDPMDAKDPPRFRTRKPRKVDVRPGFFFLVLGLAAFTAIYIAVGIRWHTYRARAALYAQREVQHTFDAEHYRRAALQPAPDDESRNKVLRYRQIAEKHERAAQECGRLRELYESIW